MHRNNTNPLLFPASVESPFDNIQGAAVLIPPSLSEPKVKEPEIETGEEGSFVGHQQLTAVDLKSPHISSFLPHTPAGAQIKKEPPPPTLSSSRSAPNFANYSGALSDVPLFPNASPYGNASASFAAPNTIPGTLGAHSNNPPSFSNIKATTPPPIPVVTMGSLQPHRSPIPGPSPSLPTPLPPLPTYMPGGNVAILNPAETQSPSMLISNVQPIMSSQAPVSFNGNSFPPVKDNVIPVSFENMASNPLPDGVYHPVMHHWFYAVGQPVKWKPFSFMDSLNLEEAYNDPDHTQIVATDGGRYDVNISEHKRYAIFWEQDPGLVRRCSWFKKGPLEAQPIPYEEDIAKKLEAEYRDAMMTGRWHRQIDLDGGDRIMIHSTRTMIHYVGVGGDYPSANGTHAPLNVKRGTEDFDISDGEADSIDHVLFLVHGIGSVCDLRFRAVEECVDDFRSLGHNLLSTHFKNSVDMGVIGRVEILPVSWHKALHGDATGIDTRLKPITLRSVPKLREFTNDTILDVLLFTSPIYCQHIMDTVASELNRLHTLFCERNPNFNGLVSLGGHSLGSVILFDLLMHQGVSDSEEDKEQESPVLPKDESTPFEKPREDSVSSSISYTRGSGQGTGQPHIDYPKLNFEPEAFFLMGSPFAMFITIRGIDTIGSNYQLPTCKRVFNIFHPFDPVAYRMETLIDPNFNLRPILIPHHKGRKRMHLEIKEQLERVGSEFKQKIVDSIQGTWNRLYQFYTGSATNSIEHEVDEALKNQLYIDDDDNQSILGEQNVSVGQLNGGRRIDYVLQEKPYESFNEYIFALQAHVTYWESEDTMLLILKELYGPQEISCDAGNGCYDSQQIPSSEQLKYEGDSALGSGTMTPSSPPIFDGVNNSNTSSSNFEAPVVHPVSVEPVPLFTAAPMEASNCSPSFSFPPNPSLANTPSVIGGRPVMDINSQPMGMDPTAPIDKTKKANVGPPPKLPSGTFNRPANFRR